MHISSFVDPFWRRNCSVPAHADHEPGSRWRLFRGVQEEHRDHASPDNLLRPHTVSLEGATARQRWAVAGLIFEATLAGGSRDECESWWVTLRRADPTSSH